MLVNFSRPQQNSDDKEIPNYKQCDARAGLFVFVFIAAIFVVVALLKLPCTSQHVHDETH